MAKQIYEVQFHEFWLIILFVVIISLMIYYFVKYKDLIKRIVLSITISMLILMGIIPHLKVMVTDKDIKAYLFPYHREITYKKAQINSIKITKYFPMLDFGGWGVRKSRKWNIKTLTISGQYAMVIEKEDYTRYIGIKDVKSTHQFLSKYYADKYIIDSSIKELIE